MSAVHIGSLLEHHDFVRALARHLVQDPHQAEDLAQEAWVAALERPPLEAGAARAWWRVTTRRIAQKLARGEARRGKREQTAVESESVTSTEELVTRLELEQKVVRAVMNLRDPHREVILLRFYEGLSPEEIAKRLDVTVGATRARLFRAIQELRTALDRTYGNRDIWMRGLLIHHATPVGDGWNPLSASPSKEWLPMSSSFWIGSIVATAATGAVIFIAQPEAPSPGEKTAQENPPLVAMDESTDTNTEEERELINRVRTSSTDRDTARPAQRATLSVGEGRFSFELIDDETSTPLKSFVARFLQEKRFGKTSQEEGLISTGSWKASFFIGGYEPYLIEEVVIEEDQETNLGVLRMRPGTGVVEGLVAAQHLEEGAPVSVILHGSVPPTRSGIGVGLEVKGTLGVGGAGMMEIHTSQSQWRQDLKVGETFRFDRLPAGQFWVEVSAEGAAPLKKEVQVSRDRVVHSPVFLEEGAKVSCRLVHPDGRPFNGARTDKREKHQPLVFEIRDMFRSSIELPAITEETPVITDVSSGVVEARVLGYVIEDEEVLEEVTEEEGVIDRPRKEGEDWLPVVETPRFEIFTPGDKILPHVYQLENLPKQPVLIRVRTQGFRGETMLDLGSDPPQSITITLKED